MYKPAIDEHLKDAVKGALAPEGMKIKESDIKYLEDQFRKELYLEVLDRMKGNQMRAARALGINRGTMKKRIVEYNFDYKAIVEKHQKLSKF